MNPTRFAVIRPLVVLLTVVGAGRTAGQPALTPAVAPANEVICRIIEPAPSVELSWLNGPAPGAVASLQDEPLLLLATNKANSPLRVEIAVREIGPGSDRNTALTNMILPVGATRVVPIQPINSDPLIPQASQFSSELLVKAVIFTASGERVEEVCAPDIFYHLDGHSDRLFVYDMQARRDHLHGGLIQADEYRLHPDLVASSDSKRSFDSVEWGGAAACAEPSVPPGTGSENPQSLWVKIRIRLKVDFTDVNVGEDYYYNNSVDKDARGIWAQVRDGNGSIVFQGYTGDGVGDDDDGFGCTPWIDAKNLSNWSVRAMSMAEVQGNHIDVIDPNLFLGWSSWLVVGLTVTQDKETIVPLSIIPQVSTTLAAASFALSRHAGGVPDGDYDLYIGQTFTKNSGGKILLAPSSSRKKFTIVHEMGHRLMRLKTGDYCNNCGYSGGGSSCQWDSDPNNPDNSLEHAMSSKEYDSCGMMEGFAHFYAATTWNDSSETDAYFKYYKNVWWGNQPTVNVETPSSDPKQEVGSLYLESNCGGSDDGYGNEMDWLRFFWDLHTDPGDAMSFTQIVGLIDCANNLPLVGGWDSDSAYTYLMLAADWWYAGGRWADRVAAKASFNGVDH